MLWSANLAYAVGLITTDGCLYNDGRHLAFVSKDLTQIRTFKRILKLNNKIALKKATTAQQENTSGYSSAMLNYIDFF